MRKRAPDSSHTTFVLKGTTVKVTSLVYNVWSYWLIFPFWHWGGLSAMTLSLWLQHVLCNPLWYMFSSISCFLSDRHLRIPVLLCYPSLLHLPNLSSVQFSRSVMSYSLQPHEPQHTRLPCPSPTPGVHPNPCPLSRWCHPTISSSVVPFSFCPQSFPASGSFPMSPLFASGGQSIGGSASATSVLCYFTF